MPISTIAFIGREWTRRLYICLCLALASECANSEEEYAGDCAGNMSEMMGCVSYLFRHADADLNKTYKELMARLDPEGQRKLRSEQRSWLKCMDSKCREMANEEGDDQSSSMWVLVNYACKQEETKSRTSELIRNWSK